VTWTLLPFLLVLREPPDIRDLDHFPGPIPTAINAARASDHADWARTQALASKCVPEWGWDGYSDYAQWVSEVWHLLEDAYRDEDTTDGEGPNLRPIDALYRLREEIGPLNYLLGRMPPPCGKWGQVQP
jgi:hypothetical protein